MPAPRRRHGLSGLRAGVPGDPGRDAGLHHRLRPHHRRRGKGGAGARGAASGLPPAGICGSSLRPGPAALPAGGIKPQSAARPRVRYRVDAGSDTFQPRPSGPGRCPGTGACGRPSGQSGCERSRRQPVAVPGALRTKPNARGYQLSPAGPGSDPSEAPFEWRLLGVLCPAHREGIWAEAGPWAVSCTLCSAPQC